MKILLILLIIWPSVAFGGTFETFEPDDYVLQSIYTAITVADWIQTKDFTRQGVPESNPFLGRRPSQPRIDTLIGSGIVAHAFISYLLPKKYRVYWQNCFIKIELNAVNRNHSIGFSIVAR